MLRLVGMYVPFVIVILGIGACSFIYQDEVFGRFMNNEEVVENESTELSGSSEDQANDRNTTSFEEIVTEPAAGGEADNEPASAGNSDNEESDLESLPGISECVCPKIDGSK